MPRPLFPAPPRARRALRAAARWLVPLPPLAAGLLHARAAAAQGAAGLTGTRLTGTRLTGAGLTEAGLTAAPRAARAIMRGETLGAADIVAAPDDSAAARLVGWTARRVIVAGEPLRAPAVAPPAAVRAGAPVAVLWRQGGVALRLAGTAATDAPLGGRVAVRVDARRRLEGVATAPGVVTLP